MSERNSIVDNTFDELLKYGAKQNWGEGDMIRGITAEDFLKIATHLESSYMELPDEMLAEINENSPTESQKTHARICIDHNKEILGLILICKAEARKLSHENVTNKQAILT